MGSSNWTALTPDEAADLQECVEAVQEVEAELKEDYDDHEIGPDDPWPWSAHSHGVKVSHEVCATCDARCCSVFEVCVYPRDNLWRFRGLLRNDLREPHRWHYDTYMYLKHFDDGDCVFLRDNKCSIYATRPITCQAWFCGRGTENDEGWRTLSDPNNGSFHSMREELNQLRREWRAKEDAEAQKAQEAELQEQEVDDTRTLRARWRAE